MKTMRFFVKLLILTAIVTFFDAIKKNRTEDRSDPLIFYDNLRPMGWLFWDQPMGHHRKSELLGRLS